jgi:hypothetical protein
MNDVQSELERAEEMLRAAMLAADVEKLVAGSVAEVDR